MKFNEKERIVQFVNKDILEAFKKLEKDDPNLFKFINRALDDLKENPFCGVIIPKKLHPKEYVTKFGITNLWKYDLPSAWRLLYTVKGNEIRIISIVLEWMDHKTYERKFKYG